MISHETDSGFFGFAAEGNEEYVLESYQGGIQEEEKGKYRLGKRVMNYRFSTKSGTILYLGHMKVTYASPEIAKKSERGTSWHYRLKFQMRNNKDEVLDYIAGRNKESAWLSYDMDLRYVGAD